MTAFDHNAPATVELGIGSRIRHYRRLRGLSLQQLSAQIQVSTATLSNIERGRMPIDIERLLALSSALSVDYAKLVPRGGGSHFQIIRRSAISLSARPVKALNGEGQPVPYHNLVRPLAQGVSGKQIEPFLIRAMPRTDGQLSFINHGHEEFFFVLNGAIECQVQTPDGLVTQTLREGDSMYFWSSLPHCIRSATSEPSDAIHVLCVAQSDRLTEQQHATATILLREWPLTLRQRVAGRVKSLRVALRMAGAEFAEAAGVSPRWLAEVERGQKPIPIDFLLALGRRFQKPLDFFFVGALTPPPYYFVQRAADIALVPPRRRRLSDGQGTGRTDVFRPLARGFPNRSMHPYYVKLQQHDGNTGPIREHHGQEFVYVLNSGVDVRTVVDGEPFAETLVAGDACFIDSTVPHRFDGAQVNAFEPRSAEAINVFWSPLGEDYFFEPEDPPG
jgi:transcriptional regulator with XRE-family HTH domain/mannose-6-phosphate isomerase-like protein (cupin superfamily)